jgi:hypothetical protein
LHGTFFSFAPANLKAAASQGHGEVTALLLAAGARLDIKNNRGLVATQEMLSACFLLSFSVESVPKNVGRDFYFFVEYPKKFADLRFKLLTSVLRRFTFWIVPFSSPALIFFQRMQS